jgi:methionine aminopeptidase
LSENLQEHDKKFICFVFGFLLLFHSRNYFFSFFICVGMVFTIEPCISEGSPDIQVLPDGWTITTRDNSRTAQFEHTILVNELGIEILTL